MSQDRVPLMLVVDDDRSALESLAEVLQKEGYAVVRARSGAEALEALSFENLELVLTDLRMREIDGMKVLEETRARRPDIPVIVMTAFAAMDTAIEAISKGAYDYISKPFKLDHLRLVVRRALEQAALRRENRKLRSTIEERQTEADIIGRSPEMVEVYKLIARVAPLQTTVLIQGESGTGKEMVARLIHKISGRRGPFKAINCGALTETLLESELFGYVKGAFTGATSNKVGIFEAAHGGTVFLDEISNTTPALQMKLLRVLEEREVLRVGSTEPIHVDVRIVAATNQPLEELVRTHAFREDLFYRLKVVTLDLPPLRQRRGDIPLLLDHFVRRYAAASSKTIAIHESVYPMLSRYDWPGNVRELENAVERAIALNSSGVLTPEDFPEEIRRGQPSALPPPVSVDSFVTLAEKEKEYILEVLEATNHNASRAAEILNIDRRTLYRILERHGIRRS
ncbi:MAG: sigma-54 dependent transcriptional regulator [Acidobacteriota bacterium]|nr:sigma-54 dependent transcriptional regulator [Blastocatellia bacterium]MDW8238203.1 sigma-54 dependent transcriptional regulator [Acidobacteriota bacterium]